MAEENINTCIASTLNLPGTPDLIYIRYRTETEANVFQNKKW